MDITVFRIALALAGTGLAAWQDAKTSFIDEKITYSMIAAGLVLDLMFLRGNALNTAIAIGAAIFGAGYFLYRTGQLGGGDVLLLTGIHFLIPYRPAPLLLEQAVKAIGTPIPAEIFRGLLSAMPFFLSVLSASVLLGLLGTALLYFPKLVGRKPRPDLAAAAAGIAAGAVLLGVMLRTSSLTPGKLAFYCAFVLPAIFLTAFRKQIMEDAIVRRVGLEEIEDEDVVMTDYLPEGIVKKYGLGRVATKEEMKKLALVVKKERIKIPIAKDLPRFGPAILAGLATAILFGDVIALLVIS